MTKDARPNPLSRPAIVTVLFDPFDDDGQDIPPATALRLYLQDFGLNDKRLRVVRIDHVGPYQTHKAAIRVPQDMLEDVLKLDDAEVVHQGRK